MSRIGSSVAPAAPRPPPPPPKASRPIARAAAAMRAAAAAAAATACTEGRRSPHESLEDYGERIYEAELAEINGRLEALRRSHRESGDRCMPSFYLRGRDPAADAVVRQLRETSKSFELYLRFREIEKLDRMHAKLWELLSENRRECILVEQYKELMTTFYTWCQEEFSPASSGDTRDTGHGLVGRPDSPTPSSLSRSSSQGRYASRGRLSAGESLQRGVDNATPLGEVLYLSTVKSPRPTIELFLSCPRNAFIPEAVDIAVIYQLFAKKVSLVKCEAELIMWDTNNDGRLSEDVMESYVRDLVPRMAALRGMSEEVLPFYCCTASRRLFWDLDHGNRGVVRVDALLRSAVMDEWVSLQLLTEDNPRNWFGAMATKQLYEKFLLLDTRNEGTLNAENLKRYKKGLPTVLDDGLPLDVSPLCTLFIDRFFETNVMMAKSEMDYRKFVDFVIAVEMLPQCSRPAFLWNILDLRGNGVVTAITANYFFRETHAKLVSAGLEVPAKETVIQEVFDLVATAEPLTITREEFIRSPQAGLFVAILIDCLSFWAYENREQR